MDKLLIGVVRGSDDKIHGYWYIEDMENIYWSEHCLGLRKYNGEFHSQLYKYMMLYNISPSFKFAEVELLLKESDMGYPTTDNIDLYIRLVGKDARVYDLSAEDKYHQPEVYDCTRSYYSLCVYSRLLDYDAVEATRFMTTQSDGYFGLFIPEFVYWFIVRKVAMRDYRRVQEVLPHWYQALFVGSGVATRNVAVHQEIEITVVDRKVNWFS